MPLRNIGVALAWLACVCHGQRVQTSEAGLERNRRASRSRELFSFRDSIAISQAHAALKQTYEQVSVRRALTSLKRLTWLLLAARPAAAFNSLRPAPRINAFKPSHLLFNPVVANGRNYFRNCPDNYFRSGRHIQMMAGTSGRVAVVTGASRGIGRAIAIELGRKGHTVYCLGRSVRGNQTSERAMPEGLDLTVESAAEAVDKAGGKGHGISCDLTTDDGINHVFSKIAEAEKGKVDILVCSAYTTPPGNLRGDFWTQGMDMWDACNGVGLRGVYSVCCNAIPMLIKSGGTGSGAPPPLVVLVSSFGGQAYTFNVAYGVGKCAIDRLASDMAYQLKKHGVGTVSLYPGIVKTEGNLEMDRLGDWDEASGGLDLSKGETPKLSGKAVCALAELGRDEFLSEYSGKVAVVAELAKTLGFAEDDGTVPPSIRSLKSIIPGFVFPQIEKESGKRIPAWIKENVPDVLLPWSVFSEGPPPESGS